ncbi:kinetochore protein Spc24-like [Coregonus clupeaformis]|uniref:kinetochore protein Spc24-like n=1 Tax=Coregonus clupeaformis TaxID=59861 RepID=UPI001BDF8ADD|nr:kinetochore protein Spc24-like [Coregonus clupeaformis]XP_045068335.1 kinetochore protein Spc24-like [Coregonus clupeaformis]
MSQSNGFQDCMDTGEAMVQILKSSKADDKLRIVREKQQCFFEQHWDTKKTITQMLNDVVQCEDKASKKLLDMEEQKSQVERELDSLEQELQQCTAKSQDMDTELQFLQRELENLRDSEQELQTLQQEVDDDTTEVIPSAIYVAQLYHKVTKIKWEYDTEPHILRGVHYGADLATPINIDTSVRSRCSVSDELWNFVGTEW